MSQSPATRSSWVLFALAGTALLAPAAFAGHYDKTKTVTWDIGDGKGGIVGGPNQSKWIALTHAMADDKHSAADNKTDAGAGAAYPRVIYDDLVKGGAIFNDTPHAQSPQPLYKTGTFDQTAVNAGGTLLYLKDLDATVSHADSYATGDITVTRNDAGAKKQVTATMKISGGSTAATPPVAHAPETSYAQGTSGVGLELKGKITAAEWSNNAGKRGKINITGGQTSILSTGESKESGTDETASAGARDPIIATYTDDATGAILGSSIVYQDSYIATGQGHIEWNPLAGISLVAPAGSSAQVEISTPSLWVTNQFNGTVGIVAGTFLATGDFASLPWNVSNLGGDITATLAGGVLSDSFDLDLDLTSLPGSMGDVSTALNSDLDGWSEDIRTVIPTPGSAALILAGTCLTATRRRRA